MYVVKGVATNIFRNLQAVFTLFTVAGWHTR